MTTERLAAVSFTASRLNFSPPPPVVENALLLRVPRADRYVTGACTGGDAFLGQWLHWNRRDAEHVVVVPALRGQVDEWWLRAPVIGKYAIRVTEMPPGTTYEDRNAELVKLGDAVYGFPAWPEDDPRSRRSGTWQTIRMARDAGKLAGWQCVLPPYSFWEERLS